MRRRAGYTPPLYLDFFSMRRDNKIGWDDFILAFSAWNCTSHSFVDDAISNSV